jgi:uncharacterized protein YndB with AHSA1/START domain
MKKSLKAQISEDRAAFQPESGMIRWRLHLRSRPEKVYEMLATDAGRAKFWAESTEENGDELVFHLLNEPGRIDGKILERVPGRRIKFEYRTWDQRFVDD